MLNRLKKHLVSTRTFAVVASLLMLSACGTTPDWDYDKSVEFTNYKTYAWSADASLKARPQNYQINGLMEKRIRNAITEQMAKQGFKLVDAPVADILINYHVAVDKKLEVDTFKVSYGARWNYWGWGVDHHTTAREYKVGTLVVDIIDRTSNQLIWRGAKESRLRAKQTPEQRTESVNKTIAEILANFPPKVQH
ncbi:DUF4136 domain-containing protein [Pseudoalteromonas rubra]|uniref:DUF4136 domain-containing protein n=1 Tax=Pseudoalteromonas rubra TaxID=43658 RepID=A0A5S3WQK0_9GAMM|nr:DUF4136 domain-containing protein [Pseudoalteromonas rubra]TMP31269.1 DUF4136 domain-containing protein [Pseudoalteromonas rubra]